MQVTVLLPVNRNHPSQNTVSSVPLFTGNVVSVLRLSQAGSSPEHRAPAEMKFFVIKVQILFVVL